MDIIDHPISTLESSPARAKSEEAPQTAQQEIPGRSDQDACALHRSCRRNAAARAPKDARRFASSPRDLCRSRRRPPGKINIIGVGNARNKKSGPFPLRVLRAQRRFKLSNHGSRRYNAARLDAQAKKAASRNLELLDRTMQKVMEVREQLIDQGSQGPLSTPAASPDIVSGVYSAAPPPR